MKTKKIIKAFCIVGCLLLVPTNANAQFWKKFSKKVQKKIERKAENKLDKKTDKVIDKTMDGDFINKKKKTKKEKRKDEVLNFNQSITLEITSNKSETMELHYFFNSSQKNLGCMKIDPSKMNGNNQVNGEMYMVFDNEEGAFYINMMGMKIKKEIKASDMNRYDNSDKLDTATITKTGKTKKILGYSCEEYIAKTKEATSHIWATTSDFPIEGSNVLVLGMKNKNKKIKGFILEISMSSKKENGKIIVKQINKNTNLTINTGEYSSMFKN